MRKASMYTIRCANYLLGVLNCFKVCPGIWVDKYSIIYRDHIEKIYGIIRRNIEMKVFLVNGSPHAKGCTYTALE